MDLLDRPLALFYDARRARTFDFGVWRRKPGPLGPG